MKTILSLFCALAIFATGAFSQVNTLTSTTTSAAILATDSTVTLTSTTGVTVSAAGVQGSQLYVVSPGNVRGETMQVKSLSGSVVTVIRARSGIRSGFPSGATVLIGSPNWFYAYDPAGSCVTASLYVSPWVNTLTGSTWLCSSITTTWVPGFANATGEAQQVTAAVASVAGATAVNGPLQHITGTNAITSFTMGIGWSGQAFTVIPDGAFTTTATNNIGKASTAVVNRPLTFTWDATNSVFVPSY